MTELDSTLLVVHLAATAAMMGLIWFVQHVHYPLFGSVGRNVFSEYESEHQVRTSWVVGPLMGVEGISALAISISLRHQVGLGLTVAGLALLAVIHGSTLLLQVPAHGRLTHGYDADVHRRLVRTNWLRTAGWSLRTLVAAAMIVVAT